MWRWRKRRQASWRNSARKLYNFCFCDYWLGLNRDHSHYEPYARRAVAAEIYRILNSGGVDIRSVRDRAVDLVERDGSAAGADPFPLIIRADTHSVQTSQTRRLLTESATKSTSICTPSAQACGVELHHRIVGMGRRGRSAFQPPLAGASAADGFPNIQRFGRGGPDDRCGLSVG